MMRRAVIFALFLAVFLMVQAGCAPEFARPFAPAAEQAPQPLTGDAASRLGAAALTITKEEKANTYSIVPVFAEDGQPIADAQPVALGGAIAYGFSTDRAQIAYLSNRAEGCLTYCLHVLDLRTWAEVGQPIPVDKRMSAWFTVPAFDPASGQIPLILHSDTDTTSEILLVDRAQGQVAARADVPASIFKGVYTPQGDFAVYGLQNGRDQPLPYLALLDGQDLSLLWENNLAVIDLYAGEEIEHSDPLAARFYDPAYAFAQDGSRLYLAAADQPLLVTVDFLNQSISTAQVQPKLSFLERLLVNTAGVARAKAMNGITKTGVLSPDGRYLYVIGQEYRAVENSSGEFEVERIPLGLQVIDAQTGTLVQTVETQASQLVLSPDAKTLLLHGWDRDINGRAWTDALSITSWTVTQRLEGTAYPSLLLDGSLAYLVIEETHGSRHTISLFRPGDSTPLTRITQRGYLDWVPIP